MMYMCFPLSQRNVDDLLHDPGIADEAFASCMKNAEIRLTPREGSTPVPPPPPLALQESFSRSGCGQNFPLFSRVMRDGLLTGLRAKRPESVLSGPIFSGPVNRSLSGEQLQASVYKALCVGVVLVQFDIPVAIRAGPRSNLRGSINVIMPLWRNHRLPLAATHEHRRLPQAPSFRPM